MFLFLTLPLLAIEEGTYVQFQEAEEKTKEETQEIIPESYQNPLLKSIKAPSEKKELSLQQQIVDYFGTFVTSSPYPGVRATLDGTDLMSSLSNVNKDLQILLELKEATQFMDKKGIPYPVNPRIFLSGEIEFTGFVQKDATGRARSDLNLTDAEIDFLIVAAPWLYGFIGIEYDSSLDPARSLSRVANSRLHADSLFITFGDLTKQPWYGTIGQTYIPYGQYTTFAAVHVPLTRILFRTLARNVAVGFFNHYLHCTTYVFKGDSHADSGNNLNNYGMNLGLRFKIKELNCKLAVGAIRNVADSVGMQGVFGNPLNGEQLHHVVPGINCHGNFSWGNWTLLLAYNQALRPFNRRDIAFSGNGITFKGARPAASDAELAYSFKLGTRPSSIALGYSRSWEALSFNVPKERATLTWALYIFRGNILSLELNSDKLYDQNNRVSGNVATGLPYYLNPRNLGHRDYTFSVDYLLYF
ncbi:MAG: LbtU family siderophore porin [Chlamydiia bacterium]|nr:LbtU family siderophore porin [Chlamydiia bacterium]